MPRETGRPRDYERHRVAAPVGGDLVEAEGGIAGHGPAPGVVRPGGGATDLVVLESLQLEFAHVGGEPGAGAAVGEIRGASLGPALPGGAIVAGEDEDGVVELAEGLELG